MEENFETFGGRLKYLMRMHGMTNSMLAERLHITSANIYRYLNGIRKPSVEKVLALADIFAVDVAWLIGQRERYPRPDGK